MFDGQLVRPSERFRAVAKEYVCVRVVNVNEVDLNLYPFDHDLTLAIVLAHPDGTVFHRYGGRDSVSPMNMDTLVDLMRKGLESFKDYHPQPRPETPSFRLRQLIEGRLKDQIQPTFGCYHCHYAVEARRYLAMEDGQWAPDQFWIWPLPEQLGLVMDSKRQHVVREVLPHSAATKAGIEPGDDLQRLAGQRVLTKYDIQWVLEQCSNDATELSFGLRRGGENWEGTLRLGPAWKVGDPAQYKWRVRNVFTEHMTKFMPAPGFIGEPLSQSQLTSMGLAEHPFGLKITHLNQGTYLAGIRRGDVVLSAGERAEFPSPREFYYWCEMLRRQGRDIKMEILRQGSVMSVMVSSDYLNYARIAKAPRVYLGFIVQEMPGDRGLRVGHVTDHSGAERTGLQIGDRILAVDGEDIGTRDELDSILNNKSPGELLTLTVRREERVIHLGYVLPGEEVERSDLARLDGSVHHVAQRLTCVTTLRLPPGEHVYSVYKEGFGLPTMLEFRGRGYRLIGSIEEPPPREVTEEGLEPMWILEGKVELKQVIEVTDPAQFQLLLRVYAQVCDAQRCHEFQSIIVNDGRGEHFMEFRGNFDQQPLTSR